MTNCIFRISSLARLQVIDGLRRHALIGLIVFALVGEVSGLVFFDFIPRDIGRASSDFLFSISWITGVIFLLFHAVQAATWGEHKKNIHTFLARPISRAEYLLGIFTGQALLLMLLNLILAIIGWFTLNRIKAGVDPYYFQHLSSSAYILATTGLYSIELIILSVILLLSGAIRGTFPVLLLTLAYHFICTGLPVVRDAIKVQGARNHISTALPTLLKWLTAVFPDFSRLDYKLLVTSTTPSLSGADIVISFGISFLYILIVLCFASLLYQQRDLM